VLVNGNSASCSEMLAGVIKDNHVGTLVGTTTYGKGTMQGVLPLEQNPGGGYKITTAEFFTTSHKSFDGEGIEPDIKVEIPYQITEDDVEDLVPLNDKKPVKVGDTGLNVYGIEERLSWLGYDVKEDGIYDEDLNKLLAKLNVDTDRILTQDDAVKFQKRLIEDSQKPQDVQLDKAIQTVQELMDGKKISAESESSTKTVK